MVFVAPTKKQLRVCFVVAICCSVAIQFAFLHLLYAESGGESHIGFELSRGDNSQKHVVFSCYICSYGLAKCSPTRKVIEENSRVKWQSMGSNVVFLDFTFDNATATNRFGVPILSSLYQRAQVLVPKAKTYTYVNGDILPNSDFEAHLQVLSSYFGARPFLMIGERTEIQWKPEYTNLSDESFLELYKTGPEKRRNAAIDYFIFTGTAMNWSSFPKMVIGRRGYDQYLVDYAHHKSIAVVDSSSTFHVIHQTDETGGKARGGKMIWSKPDSKYNIKLVTIEEKDYDHGFTTVVPFRTCHNSDGNISVCIRDNVTIQAEMVRLKKDTNQSSIATPRRRIKV